MLQDFLNTAKAGDPVYISTVYDAFSQLEDSKKQVMHCILTLLEADQKKLFTISLPLFEELTTEEIEFAKNYLWAEVYNALSSLGGKEMNIYIDPNNDQLAALTSELNEVFCINSPRSKRNGYGRCVNVIDRMLSTLCKGHPGFKFITNPLSEMPEIASAVTPLEQDARIFKKVTENLEGKIICGMDVGGTDIKIVLVHNGKISCYKEYDWFPALFKESSQLVEPICLMVRLVRAKISLDHSTSHSDQMATVVSDIYSALANDASEDFMLQAVENAELYLNGDYSEIDAIGLCFPDVVVKDKVVGGECFKTRGIRNNPEIDYEVDFLQLTNLNDKLHELISKTGYINMINDGPMASFTAAVEIAASSAPAAVDKGVFAHTLGTELGTGWVDGSGFIPDIPLEVYNFIIDLGSYGEKQFPPDDLRSINNFNTDLPGTLQKYCSQSGVFRLAMKYFPQMRPDLYKELFEKGLVVEKVLDGQRYLVIPTEPTDQRKPFLEHMMALPERENDEANALIWRNIGEFLAVTWLETEKLLSPGTPSRVLFGRLVKNKRCFELIKEGAKKVKEDIVLEVADATMANTPLMKQLEDDPHYTVAQFAQAIGAVYYGNLV